MGVPALSRGLAALQWCRNKVALTRHTSRSGLINEMDPNYFVPCIIR